MTVSVVSLMLPGSAAKPFSAAAQTAVERVRNSASSAIALHNFLMSQVTVTSTVSFGPGEAVPSGTTCRKIDSKWQFLGINGRGIDFDEANAKPASGFCQPVNIFA
jgi:hypothetical protein